MPALRLTFSAVFLLFAMGCASTTRVATSPTSTAPDEVFWAKNQIAEQTATPGAVRFSRFESYALSNGDRVYCGDISAPGLAGSVPFYMRSRGTVVKAIEADLESADFVRGKCAEARKGALRINEV
ncbi:hypothetical protein [Shimia sp.]|uniref:hypothetical protein n=1 Tax=Shimia sp. TaxID=1954381 RepID=UPI003BABF513